MTPLLRYWLIPGGFRRLRLAARIALTVVFLLGAAFGFAVIRGQRLQAVQSGSFLIPAIILYFGLPSMLAIFGSFAGATLIAGERQRQTWETLLLSLIRTHQVVLLKFLARLVFCLILALPASIWFAALAYKICQFGGTGIWDSPSQATLNARSLVYAVWTPLQVIGHLPPFVAFGMAVSARCSKVNHALLICAACLTAYGVTFWMTVTNIYGQRSFNSPDPGLLFILFRWPAFPFMFGRYASITAVLPQAWPTHLCADLIWMVAVPLVLLIPTITWSRLSRRVTPRKAFVEV